MNEPVWREYRRNAGHGSRPTVLFFTDNGLGLGHIARASAVAGRAGDRFHTIILTMSAAYSILGGIQGGIAAEYFPPYLRLGLERRRWLPLLADRLSEALESTGASVLVVDHVNPPSSLRRVREAFPGVRMIWTRRGLWQEGKNHDALGIGPIFDVIVEPGDIALAIDRGATAGRSDAVRVHPVVSTTPDGYLPRDQARRSLGIPAEGRAVLIALGASHTDSLRRQVERVREVFIAGADTEMHFFAPLHPLHLGSLDEIGGVITEPAYPVVPFVMAFDAVVSNAGYNSFHEFVLSGLPVVFVARDANVDDQWRRAMFAELCGRGYAVESVFSDDFPAVAMQLMEPSERRVARATAFELGVMDGAVEFADLIAQQADLAFDMAPMEGSDFPVPENYLAVDAMGLDQEALATVVEASSINASSRKPVFLVGSGSSSGLIRSGLPFESVMDPEEWQTNARRTVNYSEYVQRRIRRFGRRYGKLVSGDVTSILRAVTAREP